MLRKRPFGNTGLEVTEIGLGGIPIMRCNMEEAAVLVNHALDRGINYLDSARAYGDSEAKFGQVLKHRRSECFVATKTVERTKEGALQQLAESLEALQTDVIDVWQFHDVSTRQGWVQAMGPGGALEAAREAQAEGQVRFVGITGHNIAVLQQAIESGQFASVLCVYNLGISDTDATVIRPAAAAGMGVAIMKPLSGGIFFRHLKEEGAAPAISPDVAWRYVLSNAEVSTALAGVQELRDIDQAVDIAEAGLPLSPQEAEPYVRMAVALGEDVCRDCRYCRDCPEEIEVWRIMQMLDRARVYSYEWPKFRTEYAQLAKKADACLECGQCEEACPFDLGIMERLKKAHEQFNLPV